MANPNVIPLKSHTSKNDADYVFYELTRSICPACRRVIDAHIVIRNNKVYMRKRCPDHGPFEALVYGDADAYTKSSKFNKPGTISTSKPPANATAKRKGIGRSLRASA